jgi:hypothetical protein
MRLTIVKADNTVVIDGVAAEVDCSEVPIFVHAIQWDSDRGRGQIEFVPDSDGTKHPNMRITDVSQYGVLVERWRLKRAEAQHKQTSVQLDEAQKRIASDDDMQKLLAAHQEEQERVFKEAANRQAVAEAEKADLQRRVRDLEEKHADLEQKLEAANQEIARRFEERKTVA